MSITDQNWKENRSQLTARIKLKKLKIKAKSLAEEARIIRKEIHTPEYKAYLALRDERWGYGEHDTLQFHNRDVVRVEARATHLARGYLNGKAYSELENPVKTDPYLMGRVKKRAISIIKKYTSKAVIDEELETWFKS